MKRTIIILSALVGFLVFSSTSCEDPVPHVTVKPIESAIYNQIKAHRESNGLSGPFNQLFPMAGEAQLYSAKMAFGSQAVDTSGIQTHWDIIHDKYAGTNDLTLVQSIISSATAAEIVKVWTDVPETDSLILLDYSQCAAGVEINNGIAYVTLMMMLIE